MGDYAEITVYKKNGGKWKPVDNADLHKTPKGELPLEHQRYSRFGFLANIRNYSVSPVLKPRTGIPKFMPSTSDQFIFNEMENFGHTWILLSELLSFNYSMIFEDRRNYIRLEHHKNFDSTLPKGEGVKTTMRDFLVQSFFDDLELLKALGQPAETAIFLRFS